MTSSWTCQACTLSNKAESNKCELCETVKPDLITVTKEQIVVAPKSESYSTLEEAMILDENARLRKQKEELRAKHGHAYVQAWEKRWGRWAKEH